MSLTLVAALAAAPSALPACAWDRPGHNAFMGDVVAAVDRYQDIPAATRAKLKARMAARQYDEIVSIRRDSIQGQARYGSEIRDMHFGAGQTCGTVSRAAWSPDLQERGLVYCEDGQCILVPTVCRNVSRIQRTGPPAGPATAGTGPAGGAGGGGGGAGGAGSGDDPGAAAAALPGGTSAALPAAGLGGLPAGQNAPGSFASSAGIGRPGNAGGGALAGGAGPGSNGVADGASAAGSAPGAGSDPGSLVNLGNNGVGGAPPLWASSGVGALLAGLNSGSGGSSTGSADGGNDSFASGTGGGAGAAGTGSLGSGAGVGGGLGSGSGTGTGTNTGTGSSAGNDGASDGVLDGDASVVTILQPSPPSPAPPGLLVGPEVGNVLAAIPEAQTGWMMALGAALVLLWRRLSARPSAAQRRS